MTAKEELRRVGQGYEYTGLQYYSLEEQHMAIVERQLELKKFLSDGGYSLEEVKRLFNKNEEAQQKKV